MSKYVLITGAYGGLGEAMAAVYASHGYGLVLLGRNPEKLQTLEKKFTAQTPVISIECDVSNWVQCQSAYNQLQTENIQISVLINNAGITYIKTLDEEYDIERYQQLIATNLNGVVYMTKLFLNDIRVHKGSIINISSVIGYAPVIGRTAYAASKFGMEGFFSVLDAEQHDAVHIMMVYPTFIATGIRKDVKGKKEVNEILTADYVADKIYTGMTKRQKKLYLGSTALKSKLLYKYFPKIYVHLMRQKISKTTT
ncbi:MAG: hypothetical protein CSA01_00260 [Bacteroidetes bacterium]|nr:MAG: hypothetical protein CSA01_00260 [Bacteroidota bacterium]